MSLLNQKWKEAKTDAAAAEKLAVAFGLPVAIANVLVARGFSDPEAARRYLEPSFAKDFVPPSAIPGISEAAAVLWQAIRAGKSIIVYGDYDVDGVSALAILVTALKSFQAKVSPFIPDRAANGYGLTDSGIDSCIRANDGKYPDVLVTVDCGIVSVAEAARLREHGVTVIITDHHEPGPKRPDVAALVDPALGSVPPEVRNLCGAGIAFKLVHALVGLGRKNGWYSGGALGKKAIVLAGLATVTDIVPLVGENRILVKGAFNKWKASVPLGLQSLLTRAASRTVDCPTVQTFGFVLGPRLNAAGRMASARLAYELLTTVDPDRAFALAVELEGLNAKRRTVEQTITDAATLQCGLAGNTPASLVARGAIVASGSTEEGWHPGVLGIVAARLSRASGLPAAVIAFDKEGAGKGSIRAPDGYQVMTALNACRATLCEYGGHAQAAGFSLDRSQLSAFAKAFAETCRDQRKSFAAPELEIDGWLNPGDVTLDFIGQQDRLEPFGYGNRAPHWGLRGVVLKSVKVIGQHGDHLQLGFELPGGLGIRGVWFGQGRLAETLRRSARYDLAFQLEANEFQSECHPEFQLLDMAPC